MYDSISHHISMVLQVFDKVLSELEPVCLAEQDFCCKFFHLLSEVQPAPLQVMTPWCMYQSNEKIMYKMMTKNLNITSFVTLRPVSPNFDYKERCLCFHRKNKYMCTVKFRCLYHSILRPVHYKDHIQYYTTNFTVIKLMFCY